MLLFTHVTGMYYRIGVAPWCHSIQTLLKHLLKAMFAKLLQLYPFFGVFFGYRTYQYKQKFGSTNDLSCYCIYDIGVLLWALIVFHDHQKMNRTKSSLPADLITNFSAHEHG